jgi:phosphoribosyl 1,2-cyclic phosphate phosphodiesterase
LGYRIGALGYVTDMTAMPEESYRMLDGVEVLVINALRTEPHPTHQSISEAIETAKRIGAKETYFIHMSHHAGLHAEATKLLPPHIHFAFDGLEITV